MFGTVAGMEISFIAMVTTSMQLEEGARSVTVLCQEAIAS